MTVPTNPALHPFSFDQWYPLFRRHTFRSVIVDLPADFVEYLSADGIALPEDEVLYSYHDDVDTDALADDLAQTTLDGPHHSDDENDDDDSDDEEVADAPVFPELESSIHAAIAQLGGAVFPKLNWSAPRDAAWINLGGTLRCQRFSDILLLLKASDFAAYDLSQAIDRRVLVLRKWIDVHPAKEFRCWVRNGRVFAISQRDTTHYYPFLVTEQDALARILVAFIATTVVPKFSVQNFCIDMYLSRADNEPFIIDINPSTTTTDALLFTHAELDALPENAVTVRVVESEAAAAQSAPVFAAHRIPHDVVELSQGLTVAEFAEQWQKQVAEASVGLDG
ncbi:hypothetical protein GGF32_008133 [Allomyces javanicus]|nr:hypothetical protein GGF32_008133 [Allomyces javanicus]